VRRAGYSIAAGFLFFTALRSLPLADITVLVFGGSFFMTLLSAPILGERVGLFRWSAVLIGFSGVVIAAQPSGDNFGPPTFFALSASLCYAMLVIETRRMSRTESTFALTFYTTFGGFLTMAIAAPFVWQPVAETAWPWLLLMAVFSPTAHVLLAKAFIHAPVSTIAPFEYTSLVWAAILGFVFFGDVPGANVWLGAAIVIAAGIIIVQREARLSRSQQPTQPTIGD
jgi:drug/metabolite transporter (DMT)-like permease